VPFIPVALLTAVLHRMDRRAVAQAWRGSFRLIAWPALTLVIAVSLTQIMIQSATNELGRPGMMEALSSALASAAGPAIPFVAPWIGALGAFVTGSNTSSNILFAVLQHDAAGDVGVSRTIVVALQNVGGGIGNMVSVLNIAAISGVVGMSGREGELLRRTLAPTVVYAVVAGALGLALTLLFTGVY
jgi:lactate permease